MTLALLCAGLIAASPADSPPDVLRDYREARSHVGRSSDEQVKLALWCEAHGLTAERLNHLALAVLANPANATARGLMGLVAYQGRWQRPEAVAEKVKANAATAAKLAEYDNKRLKAPYTADGQWALGVWCDEHGLKDQAKAHLTAVTRLDPSREHAWKRLGYKKHGSRWATDAELAAEHAEAEAQKLADKHWIPVLERYKAMLAHPEHRAEAEAALLAITDPRAVPSITRAFIAGRGADPARAVQLLGQIDSPSASRTLAGLAVFPKSADVRRAAVETLRRRDPRDFVRLWIALIRQPIKFEVKPVGGPGSPGVLFVEGERANLRRVYAPPPLPVVPEQFWANVTYDNNGLPVLHVPTGTTQGREMTLKELEALAGQGQQTDPKALDNLRKVMTSNAPAGEVGRINQALDRATTPVRNVPLENPRNQADTTRYRPVFANEVQIPIGEMVRETQMSATVAQQQLANDVAGLERTNAAIRESNEPVLAALKDVTGGHFGADPRGWNRWWTDQLGYALMTSTDDSIRPTVVENVPIGYIPTATAAIVTGPLVGLTRTHHSCFGAGTPVRTIDGSRSIESIRAGDLVLVQDTRAGSLSYQPVVAVYHNPPSPTLRVTLGDEAIVVTGIHRFWKAGKGWTMARDLKVGDPIRTLGGVVSVASIEDNVTQPVFNLEVADGRSFLVGRLGALVHDNSLVEATPAPFDAEVAVVAVGKPAK